MIPKILKGDDTNANGKSITITYPAGQYVGLRLEFAFLGHKKVSANLDKHGGSFTIDFTAEQTKVMPLGTHFASMALLDSADRRYTITNTLKLLVTDDVAFAYDGESNNISLDVTVTGGIPDLSDVNTAPQTPNALVNSFKEVVDRLNAARPVLASALLSLASLCAFGFGVTPKTAPLGDVKFTDGVVTGVTFSSEGLLIDNAQMLTNSANFRLAVKAAVPSVEGAAEIATNAAKYIAASASITNEGAVVCSTNAMNAELCWKMNIPKQTKVGQYKAIPSFSTLVPYANDATEIQNYKSYFSIGSTYYYVYADVGHIVTSKEYNTDDLVFVHINKLTKQVGSTEQLVPCVSSNYWAFSERYASGGQYIHGEFYTYGYMSVGGVLNYPLWTGASGQAIASLRPRFSIVTNDFGGLSYALEVVALNGEMDVIGSNAEHPYEFSRNSGEFNQIYGLEGDPNNPIELMSAILMNTSIGLYYSYYNLGGMRISTFANDAGYVKGSEWGEQFGVFKTNVTVGASSWLFTIYAKSDYGVNGAYDADHAFIEQSNSYSLAHEYQMNGFGSIPMYDGYSASRSTTEGFPSILIWKNGNIVADIIISSWIEETSTTPLCFEGDEYFASNRSFYFHNKDNNAHSAKFATVVPTSRTVAGKPLTSNVNLGTLTINGQSYDGSMNKTINISGGADTNVVKDIVNSSVNGTNTLMHGCVITNNHGGKFYVSDYGMYVPRNGTAGSNRTGGGIGCWYVSGGKTNLYPLILHSGGTSYHFSGSSAKTQSTEGPYSYSDGGTSYIGTAKISSAGNRPGMRVNAGSSNSDLIPDGSDFLTRTKANTLYEAKGEGMDYVALTNTVNAVKEQFYDQPLQVNWTMRMVNGEMKLYATTNTNQSVLQ